MIYVFVLLALIVVIVIIIWVAYSVSAAYQQTLTVTLPFEDTYRYIPSLNKDHKYKLDSIKVTVTGRIKKDINLSSTIVPGDKVKQVIKDNIIDFYKDSLLIQEAHTFTIEEEVNKRYSISKIPTLENLSIIFFNKLAPLMPKLGCQLISVQLNSEGLKVDHSRYKMSNYKV